MDKGKRNGKRRGALHLLEPKQVRHAVDGDLGDGGGLLLRVREGRASWVFRYSAPSGKRREMGLGVAHRGSLAQAGAGLESARDAAHKARELLKKGTDPIEAKRERRQAAQAAEQAKVAERQRERWTLARCCRDYHERIVEPNRSPRHSALWISSLQNHLRSLWDRPVGEITPPELLAALLAIRPHERARNVKGDSVHETVRRIRQRLEVVFADAQFHGRCPSNPAAAIKAKLREARPKGATKGHWAALDYRQAPAFAARLRALPGTAARSFEFAMLTAARTTEVLKAEWSEIDMVDGVWRVPPERTKTRKEHMVPLSARAIEIIRGQIGQSERWLFPSPMYPERPQSSMAFLEVLGRLDMRSATTPHGLCRSSFSSWAAESGAGRPDVVEACLAHREADAVRRAYMRATFDQERRELLERWSEFLSKPAQPARLVATS